MWTISGSVGGLCLVANIFVHDSALVASPANPYTVSVGIPTSPPCFKMSAQCWMFSSVGSRIGMLLFWNGSNAVIGIETANKIDHFSLGFHSPR